jgi:hypothetical protein
MPALPPYITEPVWQQFSALLPEREVVRPVADRRRGAQVRLRENSNVLGR